VYGRKPASIHAKGRCDATTKWTPATADSKYGLREATKEQRDTLPACKVCSGRIEREKNPPKKAAAKPTPAAKPKAKPKTRAVDNSVTVTQVEPQPKNDPVESEKARVEADLAAAREPVKNGEAS
jgi:hypothetical protein